jgi:hypothetical protein
MRPVSSYKAQKEVAISNGVAKDLAEVHAQFDTSDVHEDCTVAVGRSQAVIDVVGRCCRVRTPVVDKDPERLLGHALDQALETLNPVILLCDGHQETYCR